MGIKRYLISVLALFTSVCLYGVPPQFTSSSYAGWVYNNPNIEVNEVSIMSNSIVLYTDSRGLPLTLTSPEFSCYAHEVVKMKVMWVTEQWLTEDFDESKVALTAAVIDENGVALDSVTVAPARVQRVNNLEMVLAMPHGMNNARLRFASWKADVNSCGAIQRIMLSSTLKGDVNQDGEVTVADINVVTNVILGGISDAATTQRADVNEDGEISLADINMLVEIIVG